MRRSIEWMFTGAARIAEAAGLKVVTEMGTLRSDGTLPEGSLQQLQPCLREAVTNVVKHARASTVFLRASMTRTSMLHLEVEDDGQGMSVAAGSPGQDGLQNLAARMRQIGGRCEMAAEPGRGVLVFFEIPVGAARTKP
jgi:signal transduction histidine kinase